MLTVLSNPRRACDGLARRELLQIGGAGLLGMSLPKVWAAESAATPLVPRAKSVLFHWTYCFPCLFAGAGVRGGITYGQSDKDAAYPMSHPVSPADLAATIYESLGVSPDLRIPDAQGRPVPLVENGRALRGLYG